MHINSVENLSKHFRVAQHHIGRWGTIRNLVNRRFQLVKAVDGVSFDIQEGELVGYLGPNGAGKSTTIKMLTGLLVPSEGEISVNGRLPWKERRDHVAEIGAVFGQRTTHWWDLPVVESLSLLRHVYKIPSGRFEQNLSDFTELLELAPFLKTPVRSLSLGQRMRADLCAALLHDPAILFLDEPTIGLDVVAKERIRQFIRHVNQTRRTTVILTTHDMGDVEKLCRRVMIIDRGRLLYDGTVTDLRQRFGGRREHMVDFVEPYRDVSVDGAVVLHHDNLRATYGFERDELTASELLGIVSDKFRIRDLEVREEGIDETIRRIYEKRLLDA